MLAQIRKNLLKWFKNNGRSFFWRIHADPYTVLISEILLKKTSAEVVNRFIPDFLERYGSMADIHDTTEVELESMLRPLGLSSQRAKQLKALAAFIVRSYDGEIPSNRDELLKLPGIGEYTAGALLSFSLGRPEAIVDTNVARIIMRLWGIQPSRCEARRSPEVWDKARQLVTARPKQVARINWALLDLGALICKPSRPRCDECTLKTMCTFAALKLKTIV